MQIWRIAQKFRSNRRYRRLAVMGFIALCGFVFTYGKVIRYPPIQSGETETSTAKSHLKAEEDAAEFPKIHSRISHHDLHARFESKKLFDGKFVEAGQKDFTEEDQKLIDPQLTTEGHPLLNAKLSDKELERKEYATVFENEEYKTEDRREAKHQTTLNKPQNPLQPNDLPPNEENNDRLNSEPDGIPTRAFNFLVQDNHKARESTNLGVQPNYLDGNNMAQPLKPIVPPTPPPLNPHRKRGQKCPKTMGKVGIFVVYTNSSVYTHATDVAWCYAISKGYPFFLIQPYEDPLSIERCGHLQQVKYRKHCVAAAYLEKVDWMLISDGDTGVINGDHCLEEYIDPRAEIILYERFFSAEIASGNYFAKNTAAARQFIREWADIELEEPPMPYYFSADNGAIHLQVHRTIYPQDKAMHQECVNKVRLSEWPNWEPGYGAFVRCVKSEMLRYNATRVGQTSPRLLMVPRAQSWVRDARETWYHYYWGDFMAHGIKETEPYDPKMLERLALLWDKQVVPECLNTEWQPAMTGAELVTEKQLRDDLRISDEHFSQGALLPLYGNTKMSQCWPHCPPDFITYGVNNFRPSDLKPLLRRDSHPRPNINTPGPAMANILTRPQKILPIQRLNNLPHQNFQFDKSFKPFKMVEN